MKNKNIALTTSLLFTMVLAILVLPIMSALGAAGTVLEVPVTGTNYTTLTFNCTTNVTDCNACEVATIYYSASGAAATTFLGNITNDTANDIDFTQAISIEALADATTYNFTCGLWNATGFIINSTGVASVGIDNTAPLCTLDGDHKTIPWKGNILLTWTTYDATTTYTTSVTIDGPQDQVTITDTDTNDSRTLTSQETKYWGDWTVTMIGTDSASNTCTETFEFKSYLPDGEIWEAGEPKAPSDTGKILLGLLIVGVIVYFAFVKKK